MDTFKALITKENLFNLATEYKSISLSLSLVVLIFISSFIFSGKIVLRKSKKHWYLKSPTRAIKFIDNVELLRLKRDELALDLALITHKNKASNMTVANNVICVFAGLTVGMYVISIMFMEFTMLKIVSPLMVLVILMALFSSYINGKRKMAQRDFGKVVQIFTSQYAKHESVFKAFQGSIYTIPDSHKYEFSRLLSTMGSSSDYIKALREYGERINDTMCYIFVDILIAGYTRNDNVLLSLVDMESYIAEDKKNSRFKSNRLKDKKLNIYLGMMCIVGGMVANNKLLLGDFSRNLYFNSFFGTIFIAACVITVTVVILVMTIVNKLL